MKLMITIKRFLSPGCYLFLLLLIGCGRSTSLAMLPTGNTVSGKVVPVVAAMQFSKKEKGMVSTANSIITALALLSQVVPVGSQINDLSISQNQSYPSRWANALASSTLDFEIGPGMCNWINIEPSFKDYCADVCNEILDDGLKMKDALGWSNYNQTLFRFYIRNRDDTQLLFYTRKSNVNATSLVTEQNEDIPSFILYQTNSNEKLGKRKVLVG